MSIFEAIILGLLQGITEFFPVSSSTHIKIAKIVMGTDDSLLFDLVCHLGTAMAAIVFLRREIVQVFLDRKKMLLMVAALVPLVPCYFLFKPLREAGGSWQGVSLFITAGLLFLASYSKEKTSSRKMRDVVFIGAMQGMALIPGISRSGSTISAACFRGWEVKEAVRFSFLLAIPTVFGGSFLECAKVKTAVPWTPCLVGFILSFVVGLGGIKMICTLTEKKKLRPFAYYCIALGIFTLLYL